MRSMKTSGLQYFNAFSTLLGPDSQMHLADQAANFQFSAQLTQFNQTAVVHSKHAVKPNESCSISKRVLSQSGVVTRPLTM